jgi:hypothetical protein
MQKEVTLHGGPLHGQKIVIPADRSYLFILGAEIPTTLFQDHQPEDAFPEIETRKGLYSEVRYQPTNFEWDGWIEK